MTHIALKLGYIGSNFYGFQSQPDFRTVVGELIYNLKKLNYIHNPKEAHFRIAGRTDRGVHSLGNVVVFKSNKDFNINELNDNLADDIRVLGYTNVSDNFNPRHANTRWYRYVLFNSNLDMDLLEKTSKKFIGTYDFSNFTNKGADNTIRTIQNIQVNISNNNFSNNKYSSLILENMVDDDLDILNNCEDFSGGPIFIDIFGENFLWNMVRKIIRVILDVNYGNLDLKDIDNFLHPKFSKKPVIKLTNPRQLILMDVKYNNIKFSYDEYAIMRFSKTITNNLINYKREYAISKSLLDSLTNLSN
ncbi:tRNA pseudouridine(38-40) synthase TruA [uncultured Methanobrevibacter sp.]|uniref:tRNA pseudouridine(38-40) synthase TruA n=1 Tax=uncultured Methanobrevibacter sp. TaxID=253161 RepID=UPI0025EEF32B|nr:tRNA pseudouridine(38-40) synthase TruA [uncultured Methanobrevibacter sp.]